MTAVRAVGFDLDAPPVEPPVECRDVLMWLIALELFHGHQPQPCPQCKAGAHCEGRWLAQQGLLTACGEGRLMADYWRGLTETRRSDAQRVSQGMRQAGRAVR